MYHKRIQTGRKPGDVMELVADFMSGRKKWNMQFRTATSAVYVIEEKVMGCGMASLGLLAMATIVGLLLWYNAWNSVDPEITNKLIFTITETNDKVTDIIIDAEGPKAIKLVKEFEDETL